jgi:hypothetical protein
MALHEFQIAEVDIENAARPPLVVDQLDDHPAFVNSRVIANDTLRSRGVLSYRTHQAYEIEPPCPLRRLVALIHLHLCAEDPGGSRRSHGVEKVMASPAPGIQTGSRYLAVLPTQVVNG